jgi:hypothetical protein
MKRTLWFISVSLILVSLLIVYKPDRTELDLRDLVLAACEAEDKMFEMRVSFFVDSKVDVHFLNKKVNDYIAYSNLVLTNSCIPIHRSLNSIDNVTLNLLGGEFFDEIHNLLKVNAGNGTIEKLRSDPRDLYVLILSKNHWIFDDGVMGATNVEFNDSFVILSEDAEPYILEHEFGHLAWAQHLETFPFPLLEGKIKRSTSIKNRHKIKSYARAYKCANAGTIMSYEDIRLPIYSSPLISYKGKMCGDDNVGNNLKVVKEYALELINKN